MFRQTLASLACTLMICSANAVEATAPTTTSTCPNYLNHDFKKLHSTETINLCTLHQNKPMIIINTASHCGYTHQFKDLESLYQKYKSQGVELVGFASDDFKQAAKSEMEAATICYKNYGVTFTMLAPTHVKGNNANPTFSHLNTQTTRPSWNFNKYLVSADGKTIQHFGSNTKPLDSKLETALKQSL